MPAPYQSTYTGTEIDAAIAGAVRTDIAGQIVDVTLKNAPTPDDVILIEDADDSDYPKKHAKIGSLPARAGADSNALHKSVGGEISSLTAKTNPTTNDLIVIEDSASSHTKKKVRIGDLPPTSGAGVDTTAIHDSVDGEIVTVSLKDTPGVNDVLLIEDADDSDYPKKSITIGSLPAKAGADSSAIHKDVGGEIATLTLKASPGVTDLLVIEDTAAGNAKKKITIGSFPTPSGPGVDTTAIHSDTANEIVDVMLKNTPDGDDVILIEDSADSSYPKKHITIKSIPAKAGNDTTAIHKNVGGEIVTITEKTVPTALDVIVIEDVAAANAKKRIKLGNLPTKAGIDSTAIHNNVDDEIVAVALKNAPSGTDVLLIEDSDSSSYPKKHVTLRSLPISDLTSASIARLDKISIPFIIDGGGVVIATGSKGFLRVPSTMTVTGWQVVGDQSGSITVDVKRATYAGLPSTATIVGSEKPTLSGTQVNQDLTLTTWTTLLNEGDWLEFNVDTVATVTRVTMALIGTRA
jgi:hypothetical protein